MEIARPLKLAIAGTRGIPARYGGFETFAEQLGVRLAGRGHDVTVYCRGDGWPSVCTYRGCRQVKLPTIRSKQLDTAIHTLLSGLDSLFRGFDAVLLCNGVNTIFLPLFQFWGCPVAVNVDGIERQRAKWGLFGRLSYWTGEYLASFFADSVVADAEVIRRYYVDRYHIKPECIAYGATVNRRPPGQTLSKFGLSKGEYILYVSRFEPENNALRVVEAYKKVDTRWPLVMVGDAPYASEYIKAVKEAADRRVVFTGFQFGDAYEELQSNAGIYVQATEVGGTHPALVEALGYGNCVVANGTPENIEVVRDAGVIYTKNSVDELADSLQMLLNDAPLCELYRARALKIAETYYNWEKIADSYEGLFRRLIS
jgi:glycosyltransferase involved in cell wall biosynthesis